MPITPSAASSVHQQSPSDSEDSDSKPSKKRARRIALACNRCKSRKQRCNMDGRGSNEPCRSCEKAGAECILQEKPPKAEYPAEYIGFLESRIAALEGRLATVHPDDELISDHLQSQQPQTSKTEHTEDSEIEGVTENHDSPEVKNEIAAGVALLSLNSVSEPHYLGGSSGYSWAKVLLGTFYKPPSALFQPNETFHSRQTFSDSLAISGGGRGNTHTRDSSGLRIANPAVRGGGGNISKTPRLPDIRVSQTLFNAFYMHVQARYPFVDWRKLRDWINRQEEMVVPKGSYNMLTKEGREKGTATFFVWMTYAVGARLLQGTAFIGAEEPESYYAAAIEHMDLVVTLHNLENVQAFLMMVMWSLRCASGPSVWHLTGISMRLALELGMHRRRKMPPNSTPYLEEIRKRVWWTLYGLDRWFSLSLGRPLGISDREIDQALPMDINCDSEPPSPSPIMISSKSMQSTAYVSESPLSIDNDPQPNRPFTSMTSAIHFFRLRRLESIVQKTVYSLDSRPQEHQEKVMDLIQKIEQWRDAIPKKPPGSQYAGIPCCSEDRFISKVEFTKLYLLRPLIAKAPPNDPILPVAARSCVELCDVYRRMHQNMPLTIPLSLTELHDIFLTGLTLLHLLLSHPKVIPLRESSKAIRACSTALFVYAQHFKAAEPFRDAFEDMANACLDVCERVGNEEEVNLKNVQNGNNGGGIGEGNDWEKHVGEMAAWMMNSNTQKEFLDLVTSLGFNPNIPITDYSQPNFLPDPSSSYTSTTNPQNTSHSSNSTSNALNQTFSAPSDHYEDLQNLDINLNPFSFGTTQILLPDTHQQQQQGVQSIDPANLTLGAFSNYQNNQNTPLYPVYSGSMSGGSGIEGVAPNYIQSQNSIQNLTQQQGQSKRIQQGQQGQTSRNDRATLSPTMPLTSRTQSNGSGQTSGQTLDLGLQSSNTIPLEAGFAASTSRTPGQLPFEMAFAANADWFSQFGH